MKNRDAFQVFQLVQTRRENRTTNSLVFNKPLIDAQPGQFVMVWLPDIGEKPYSILNNEPFSFAVASVGPFSEALNSLGIGSRVWARGPFGCGFRLDGRRHLMVGGGYGAAPLLFLARQARGRKDEVEVCLGARSAGDVLMADAFYELGCEVRITTEDGSLGEKGKVTQALDLALHHKGADSLYACGPVAMLSALAEIARQKNIAAQLSWEAQMRCGIGLCGSCELEEEVRIAAGIPKGWLTCKDGPVYISIPLLSK